MSNGLRRAVLLGLAAALVVLVGVIVVGLDDSPYERAESEGDVRSVSDALRQAPGEVVVTGYAFTAPAWPEMRLCDGREKGGAPTCLGPYLRLSGLALDRIPLDRDGERSWSPGTVRLLGERRGDTLVVAEVLSR